MALPQPRHASHSPNRSANVLGLSELRATTPAHGTTIGQPLSLCTGVLFVTVPAPVFVDRWTTLHTHTPVTWLHRLEREIMSAVKIVFLLNILTCHGRAIEDCSFLCGDSNSGRLEPQFQYKSSLSLVGNLLDRVVTSNQIPTTLTTSLSPTTPSSPTTATTTDSKLELTSPVTTLNPASRLLNTFQSLKNLQMLLSDRP